MHAESVRAAALELGAIGMTRRGSGTSSAYRDARYSFSSRSEDIKAIFCEHLDLLGIRWTRPNAWDIAVDRRREVAKLDAFVGPKR
jgi:hypothetical protein